jgi:SAM-dependent methyltransferase
VNLLDVARRRPEPEPWSEGEKIPWHEPGFSRRMLREHLTQEHDAASRRFEQIDAHVAWIHGVLASESVRVLDLGCGPGLYTSRLSREGHDCVGIDHSPASIDWAREQAASAGLRCTYVLGDIRSVEYGAGHDLVMLTFGELNAFTRRDARQILERAREALAEGGLLLLEPHSFGSVRARAQRPPHWYTASRGLFSDRPHLCLWESFWHAESAALTERWFVVDVETGDVTPHAQSMQAYSDDEYRTLLWDCGFDEPRFYSSLTGAPFAPGSDLMVLLARRR